VNPTTARRSRARGREARNARENPVGRAAPPHRLVRVHERPPEVRRECANAAYPHRTLFRRGVQAALRPRESLTPCARWRRRLKQHRQRSYRTRSRAPTRRTATRDAFQHKIAAGGLGLAAAIRVQAAGTGLQCAVPLEHEMEIVKLILPRRRGPCPISHNGTAAELCASGVPARCGAWRASTIRQIYERWELYRPVLRGVSSTAI
jgi:hypothetical protein